MAARVFGRKLWGFEAGAIGAEVIAIIVGWFRIIGLRVGALRQCFGSRSIASRSGVPSDGVCISRFAERWLGGGAGRRHVTRSDALALRDVRTRLRGGRGEWFQRGRHVVLARAVGSRDAR